jgi:hypothetical protein
MAEMKADDPIIDTWLLRELGKEISTALGTAEVDGEQWIFFADEDDAVLALWEGGGDFWEIIGRYPSFAELLRHIGPRLDERWSRIPVDDADRPRPIVVIAKERGVRVLHRTESGVQAAEQLARDPGKLIVDGTSWSIFSEATNHEAGELEAEQ